ncbi:unnamed protein product, partial [Mesorhabditis spiculigera]
MICHGQPPPSSLLPAAVNTVCGAGAPPAALADTGLANDCCVNMCSYRHIREHSSCANGGNDIPEKRHQG